MGTLLIRTEYNRKNTIAARGWAQAAPRYGGGADARRRRPVIHIHASIA